jgi:hypothetical protein
MLAPRARFELATLRLTAECSTVELPGNAQRACFILLQETESVMTIRHPAECSTTELLWIILIFELLT